MTMDESIARLAAAKKLPPVNYWWWKPEVFDEIQRRIEKIGKEHATVRAYPGLNEKGEPDLHFVVKDSRPKNGNGPPPINESHVCPPWC